MESATTTIAMIAKGIATNIAEGAQQLPADMLQRHNLASHHSQIKSVEEIINSEEKYLNRPLTPREREMVVERVAYLKEHEGHEGAHSEMLLIILGSLIVSQIIISIWKRYSPRSYNLSTLIGLWVIPCIMSARSGYTRFIVIWSLFSIVNLFIVRRALESPMKSNTPRLVYWWYQKVYDVSYPIGMIGYTIMILSFFHLPVLFGVDLDSEADIFMFGAVLMFYAVYFGTLGRDCVDRLSDRMATTMGYYSRTGFPKKHLREDTCAICGVTTKSGDKIHILNCNHRYHDICIRGWTIVGKKDTCPYCKEKVDMKQFQTNPWNTTQVFYLNLLDMFRMKTIVVLLPILISCDVLSMPFDVQSAIVSKSTAETNCVANNKFCVTAKADANEACFNVHSAATGWASLGFGTNGMRNAKLYVGWKNSTGGTTVSARSTGNAKVLPTVLSTKAKVVPVFDLPVPSFAEISFAFCVPGMQLLPTNGYIYAMASSIPTGDVDLDTSGFSIHDQGKGSFQHDFLSGGGTSGSGSGSPIIQPSDSFSLHTVWIIHGVFMWIAWILSPIVGIFVARFMKDILGHNWFRIHMFFMGFLTIFLTLVAFILIVLFKQPPHFDSLHQKLGIGIFVICLLQGVLGYIADAKYDPKRNGPAHVDIAHWWVGRIVWILGIVNVYLGLKLYEDSYPDNMKIIIIINFVIVGLGFVAMAVGQLKFGQVIH